MKADLQQLLARNKGKPANQRILEAAQYFLGVCEVSGPKSNPVILSWIKEAAAWLGDDVGNDDSKVAWCGCFRGSLGIATATGVPKAHYRAANWLAWGKPVSVAKPKLWLPGDTIITTRDGGHHVTLYAGHVTATAASCLGGNQSNKVCVTPIGLSTIIGVRRATD